MAAVAESGSLGHFAHAMKLTPFQYKALKIYWRYHTSGLTIGQVLRVCWRQWALLVGCAIVAYFVLAPASPASGCLAVGLFAGAIFRDIGYYRVAFRMWPVNREIYDWKRVSELIELHEKEVA